MQQVQIDNMNENMGRLTFNINNVHVSIANALRRTIMTNINTLVFRGFPHEENKIEFLKNTTKFNNEYLKQRISCIPIVNNDSLNFENFVKNYEIVIDEENNSNEIKEVTTKDIKIRNKTTNQFQSIEFTKNIFPPDPISNDYILIAILYPNFNKENEDNEKLHIVADFDIGNAGENSCWNVVHHCAYEFTMNKPKIQEIAKTIEDPLKKDDFLLLDAQRYYLENKFLLSVESIGVFSNKELVYKACDYIISCFTLMNNDIRKNRIKSFEQTETNPENGKGMLHLKIQNEQDGYFSLYKEEEFFVFTLKKDDYTIGKQIEYYFYEKYENEVSFVGFKKKHPTEKEAYIYIKMKKPFIEYDVMIDKMVYVIDYLITTFTTIQNKFNNIQLKS